MSRVLTKPKTPTEERPRHGAAFKGSGEGEVFTRQLSCLLAMSTSLANLPDDDDNLGQLSDGLRPVLQCARPCTLLVRRAHGDASSHAASPFARACEQEYRGNVQSGS